MSGSEFTAALQQPRFGISPAGRGAACADSLHCFLRKKIPQVLRDVEASIFIQLLILQEVCSRQHPNVCKQGPRSKITFVHCPIFVLFSVLYPRLHLFLFKYSFPWWWKMFERCNQLRNNQAIKMPLLFD